MERSEALKAYFAARDEKREADAVAREAAVRFDDAADGLKQFADFILGDIVTWTETRGWPGKEQAIERTGEIVGVRVGAVTDNGEVEYHYKARPYKKNGQPSESSNKNVQPDIGTAARYSWIAVATLKERGAGLLLKARTGQTA